MALPLILLGGQDMVRLSFILSQKSGKENQEIFLSSLKMIVEKTVILHTGFPLLIGVMMILKS